MTINLSEKQIEILKSAEEIFSEKGIDATSVRDISKLAGINIAMISYYFGSKQKLVESLFIWRLYTLNQELEKTVNNTTLNPYEKLIQFLNTYMERVMKYHAFHRILVREYSKNNSFMTIDNEVHQLKLSNLEFINQTIEEGFNQNFFLRKAPAEAIVMSIIGPISYLVLNDKTYMNLWKSKDYEAYQKNIIDKYYPYLLDSLKAILQYNEK